jgi:membrane associated rhomboid family serine protease
VLPLKDDIATRRFPVLTVAIILINVVMYFAFEDGRISFGANPINESKVVEYGAIPFEISHPGDQCAKVSATQIECGKNSAVERAANEDLAPTWVTIFTSMFLHGGLLHLGGNMLFLWVFGNNVEDSMSRWRFVAFYLLGGIAALAAQTAIDPNAAVPTIGASGAIAAVLGGYALLYPHARVITLVIIIFFITFLNLPALLVLGLWFLLQLVYALYDTTQPVNADGGGVAYFAHIGGFVFGLLLIKLFANRIHEDYEAQQRRIPVY